MSRRPRLRAGGGRALLGVLAICGCGSPEGEEPVPPHLGAIEQRVFKVSCVFSSCHGTSAPKEGLSLAAPSFANIVGVASRQMPARLRVAPGDPAASYLLDKIEGLVSGTNKRMPPPPNPPLPAGSIKAVRDWIAAGAADD